MKNRAFFYIFFCFSWSVWAQLGPESVTSYKEAIDKAKATHLSLDLQWLRLVRYEKSIFGRWESQADGLAFFLATQGKYDPEAELEATILAFYSTQERDLTSFKKPPLPPSCQFPARKKFIEQRLHVRFPSMACSSLDEWRNKVNAKSVSLIFSSYYLNNPSSVFGHSLIRLNRSQKLTSKSFPSLLDYGVNYAGIVNTSNPILYAIYGFAGFFPGEFSALPYYYKVREYNDYESRDLWEYDLNFSDEEVALLVDHVWELGFTNFDYYYLTENCSYHLLTLFEAIAPRLKLTRYLPYWVIPSDTVKALYKNPGFVTQVRYRPSSRNQFYKRMELLQSHDEVREVKTLTEDREVTPLFSTLDNAGKARVLDAVVDYIDYKYPTLLLGQNKKEARWKQSLLVQRSQLSMGEPLLVSTPEKENPASGHGTLRIGVSGGTYELDSKGSSKDGYRFIDGSIRFALHDFLDRPEGFPTYAKIEFLHLKWRALIGDREQLYLKMLKILDVESLNPYKRFEKNLAWRFSFGYEKQNELGCELCEMLYTRGGLGFSLNLFEEQGLGVYGMLGTGVLGSSQFQEQWARVYIGPILGLRYRWSDQLSFLSEWNENHFLTQTQHISRAFKSGLRYFIKPEISVEAFIQRASHFENENSVNIFWYF